MTTKKTPKKSVKTPAKLARKPTPKKLASTPKKPMNKAHSKTPKKVDKRPVETSKKPSEIIVKCLNWFAYILCIFFIVCYGIIFAFQIAQNNNSTLFGYSLYRVNSGSMEPTLEIGDEIIIQKTDDYQVGDIVSYLVDGKNTVTHRIISIEDDIIVAKGDANDVPDDPVHRENIIGKYVGKAKLLDFVLSNKVPILAFLGILFVFLFILKK